MLYSSSIHLPFPTLLVITVAVFSPLERATRPAKRLLTPHSGRLWMGRRTKRDCEKNKKPTAEFENASEFLDKLLVYDDTKAEKQESSRNVQTSDKRASHHTSTASRAWVIGGGGPAA